ncbi:hypothetical protein PLICRDRAFT_101874 [Plicaturopsis crispa FD-325 SS-3]|nr:hypothetical protein PLICRDRAFT_101874 [Plicaturopsis crispa FD-325 SS-3]
MPYCDRCDRSFPHWRALEQHEQNSASHNLCDDCELDFPSWLGLKEHWVQSRRHHYCQRCDEHFDDKEELIEHYHDSHAYCGPCRKIFVNDVGLHEHNRQSHHYCVQCKRVFQSAGNLNSHLNSSTHRPRDIVCPFAGCSLGFVSRSALILHLESGTCRSGVTRKKIDRFVREYDQSNIITDPARLLTGAQSLDTTYIATSASWNGDAYECYLCHSAFRSLKVLNQHLASPRHQDKVYVCPLSSCRQHFATLSGLCQHIESERCGVSKFKSVQNAMDGIMGRVGRLTL